MKIIDKMADNKFDNVCDAGVDLVNELIKILDKRGLGIEEASNVIAVAAAGISKSSRVTVADLTTAIETVIPMWREVSRAGQQGVVFDPPHRRADFIPAARNISVEN